MTPNPKFGIAIGLAIALGLSGGSAFAFGWPFHLHPKQNTPQTASPNAPGAPGALPSPPQSPTPQPPEAPPQETSTVIPPAAPTHDPLPMLIQKGILPADAATRATPLTRADLACVLVKALEHDTRQVSDFPFYRDVPPDHPAYACIEKAREKQLMDYGDAHGFYHPTWGVTRADAYRAIAHAVTGPPPSPEAAQYLLRHFPDRAALSPDVAASAAKMARARFFILPGKPETEKPALQPNLPLDMQAMAPLAEHLMGMVEGRAPRETAGTEEQALPILPGGLQLSLSPARAIPEARLMVGEGARFVLIAPVGPLPKGSQFRGVVTEAQPAHRRYTLTFTEVETPTGLLYQTETELPVVFPPRDKSGLLVQGQVFDGVSHTPPVPPDIKPQAAPRPPKLPQK